MRALLKAKAIKSTSKRRKSVGGALALKLKRGIHQRSHVVRNRVTREGVEISPVAPVFQAGERFAFELADRTDLHYLHNLGYVGGRKEVEKIRSRVVADMTKREIDLIVDAVEKRLSDRFAKLATIEQVNIRFDEVDKSIAKAAKAADVTTRFDEVDKNIAKAAIAAEVTTRFNTMDKSFAELRALVSNLAQTASNADPRP